MGSSKHCLEAALHHAAAQPKNTSIATPNCAKKKGMKSPSILRRAVSRRGFYRVVPRPASTLAKPDSVAKSCGGYSEEMKVKKVEKNIWR